MQKGVADYFVDNYEDYFYFALKCSNSFENAEEVMQETFLRLYKKNEQVENPVSRIKQNIIFAAADFYREYYGTRRKHRIKLESLDGKIENFQESSSDFELDHSLPPDIQRAMVTYDSEPGINEISDELTRGLKQVQHGDLFYIYAVEETKMEDLALACGITEPAMSNRLKKTKLRLQEYLRAA
jgi:RNA polymerase sigma factor (sigma-70 family)